VTGREFFTASTVAEALTSFRPRRRTPGVAVELGQASGAVPVDDVLAAAPLPGFARSTVDGYAVRALDTYGVSDGVPAYLELLGTVRMGAAPGTEVRPGGAVAVPTGGAVPSGADAVVMVEHTEPGLPGTVEVIRSVAPGEGMVAADEDVTGGGVLVRAGQPLRPQDLGLLAAAGITSVLVHRPPGVALVATGDEVVAGETPRLRVGQVRDAITPALAALVVEAGGVPVAYGIVPDDARALEAKLRAAVADSDVVVVSAGSSVGGRDETATAVAALGPPGIHLHGLAIRPGKPTLLAEAGDVPVVGLPGNPLSALVVFRLVGMPLIRLVGGWQVEPTPPTVTARLERAVPSAAGRVDVVQVTLADGGATPLFGASALLSRMTRADGYVLVPEEATGLDAGAHVNVHTYL
jgi:molybdopterin molybdotransferase